MAPGNGLYKASMPPSVTFSTPVRALHGVGRERADQLARLDISKVEELLLHRPRRWEDRRAVRKIAELELRSAATVRGKVTALGVKRYSRGRKSVFELIVDDGTARLHCRWWNTPYMQNYFKQGDEVFVFGKPGSLKPRTIDHPETEVVVEEEGEEGSIHINRIVPVYPLTEGLSQRWLRSLIWRLWREAGSQITEPHWAITGLPSRADAVRMLHFPDEIGDAATARRRLAMDEFFDLQLAIQRRRRNLQSQARALPCGGTNRLIKPFLKSLKFDLTGAQTRVLRELRQDLSGAVPMRRLVQGDVGSGKTVVAACCALMAIESGFKAVLMAPTEILAEQHFQTFRGWLDPLRVPVELRTGSRKTGDVSEGETLFTQPGPTEAGLVIGTHALIEGGFAPEKLGLVIIDEQHKFGVAQREKLVRKGRYPHLLVLTATPIPRTLGLTLYGDLDMSVIDELPPGRGRLQTFVRAGDRLPKVWEFIRQKLEAGRQAYVVHPRVEDSGTGGVKAVTQEFERLKAVCAPFRVGMLHGSLRSAEKEQVMRAFRANQVQVLLATSIIEVGVDVANATVMLIENAEQFGLAQLHQLRGRIGRGAHESYCILMADARGGIASERLRVLEQTNDGFEIAEADLRLRGPGELLGKEQSGMPPFRFGDLVTDGSLIKEARELAARELDKQAAVRPA